MYIKKYLVIAAKVALFLSLSGCYPNILLVDNKVSDSHFYSFTMTSIVYGPMGNCFELGCEKIKGADAFTFKPLNYQYAVDKNNVYFKRKVLTGENPKKFRVLAGNYAVGNKVYLRDRLIADADAKTFITIPYFPFSNDPSYFAKDKNFVFAAKDKISNEPENFKLLGGRIFYYDSRDVYDIHSRKALGADPLTFKLFYKSDGTAPIYGKDAGNVFYLNGNNQTIKGADVKTFEALCIDVNRPYFAKDRSHFYFLNTVIKNINSENFNCNMNTKNIIKRK
jgi:DKNYY family protein